jgi:hypothetical protein
VVVSPAEHLSLQRRIESSARDQDRLPLEKEVSRALRRASGYSAFSVGSISTVHQDRHDDQASETSTYRAIKSLLRRNIEITPPSDTDSTRDSIGDKGAQTRAFFNEQAVPSTMITKQQQTVVRVPINHLSYTDTPPASPPDEYETPFGRRQVRALYLNSEVARRTL